MDFFFSRGAAPQAYRVIAWSAGGESSRQITVTAGRAVRIGSLSGETFEILDASSGRPVRSVRARRVGQSLLISLDAQEQTQLTIESFFEEEGEWANRLGSRPGGETWQHYATGAGEALTAEVLADGGTVLELVPFRMPEVKAAEPVIPASASASGTGLSTLGTAGAGLLGIGLLAGGGGGGSSAPPPVVEPPPPVLKELLLTEASDGVLTRSELADGSEMLLRLDSGLKEGARVTIALVSPLGAVRNIRDLTISEADRADLWMSVRLDAADLTDPNVGQIAGAWTLRARLIDPQGRVGPAIEQTFQVEPFTEIAGSVTAGPVSGGIGIRLFDAQGQALALYDERDVRVDYVLVKSDGTWVARLAGNDYRGPVVIRATDLNGPAANYLDEVTASAQSLNTTLHAVAVIDDAAALAGKRGSTVFFDAHVTPLTELAARLAGATEILERSDGIRVLDSAVIRQANSDVARAFGLAGDDLLARPTPTNAAAFSTTSDPLSLSDSQKYGLVLAKLSGVDALNARSVANTLDQFETQLRASAEAGEPGTLTAIGRSLLDQGASIALSAAREGVGTFVLSGASADAVVLQKSLLGDVRIDDQIVEANGALRLLGTAAPGGALRIVRLALPSGQASVFDFTVGADGRFNVLVPRTSENDALTLVAYDVLGAELGVPLSVPVAPKVLSISRALVQGSGTPGSDVQLTLVDQDGLAGEPRTVKVDQTGLWHFRLDAGQELPLKVEARTIDDLGNVSSLARRAVGAASLGLVATRGEDGFINLSELPEPALQFEVGVPAGARLGDIVRIVVTVPSGGERILSVTLAQPDLDAGRLTLPFPLTDVVRDGPYDLAATYVGRNSSTIALNTRVVVDTLAPNTPTLASAEGLWLSGRTDSGSRVLAQKSDGTLLGHSDYAGDVGSWAIRLGRPLLAGETIQLIALDQAGNASAPLETAIQLSQVRILSVEDDAGPLRGLVFSGATIDDASPLLIGSLTAPLGSTERLVIYRNGVAVGDAVVSEKSWTFLDGNGASLLRAELSELPAGQSYTYRAQIELPGTASRVSGDFEIILSNTPIALQAPLTSAGEDGTANWRDIDEQGGIRLMYELPDRATPGDRLAAVVTNPLGQSLTLSTLVTDQHRASGSVVLLVPQAFLDRAGEHRVVSQFTSAASALTASADEVVFSVQLEAIPARSTPLDDLMIGGDLSVNYNGEAGNDTLIGGSAPDTLNGGPGTDWILGGGGDDFIYGSDRDTLAGGPGDDWFEIVTPTELRIDGDEGTNRVDLRLVYDVPAELRVDGLGGFTVDLVGDTVITGAGVYRFLLGVQPWTIVGSPLDDPFLIGGSNDDTIFGNLGDDTIDGGLAGNDLADYRDAPAGVDANLDTQRTTGGDGNDVLISIERLAGSAYDDTLSGGPGNDTLTGRGGEDRFVAQGGTDVILDLGVDRDDLVVEVAARAEAEVVQGWTASGLSRNDGEADLSSAGFAVDLSAVVSGLGWRVSNTGSATQFVGSALNDTLLGGTGDDTLRGSGGDDRLTGSVGNDFFDVDAGVDTITDLGRGDGSGSADILIVRAGASAQATAVEAWVAGSTSANYGTVDLRTAGLDIDLDAIVEGLGWRVINTGSAARFVGSQLNDTLEGGVGEDTLRGREGDDELRGGEGVDTFEVDAGVDRVMDLGLGADILRVSTGVAVDARVVGPWTAGVSSRNLGQARLQTEGHAVNLSSIVEGNGWSLSNIGAGTVLVGSGRADTISGGDGADTITGGLANDLLSGGEGADTFTVDFGIDTVTDLGRGAGPDVLVVNAGAIVNATIAQAWAATVASRNEGAATVTTSGLAVDLSGVTRGVGWLLVNEGAGTALTGSRLGDTIRGGTGEDTLTGSGGNDRLEGQAGADTFVVDAGTDTVVDLGLGADVLQVRVAARAEAEVVQGWTASGLSRNDGEADLSSAGFAVDLSAVVSGLGWRVSNTGSATQFVGSALNDTLLGGTGDDTLAGREGDDFIDGQGGTDLLDYSAAGAAVDVDLLAGRATGGAGLDTLANIEQVLGSAFNDTLTGGTGNETLTGAAGADLFRAKVGIDVISDLGRGADDLQVLAGAEARAAVVQAWAASGLSRNDGVAIVTTQGSSVNLSAVQAGSGWRLSNTGLATGLTGSGLADTLTGGAGDDTLTGEGGADHFLITAGTDRITDIGVGVDVLIVSVGASVEAYTGQAWTATAQSENSGTARISTEGLAVDLLAIQRGTGYTLVNTGGGTVLRGSQRVDTIQGGEGDDTIKASPGNDTIDAGSGFDLMDFQEWAGAVTVDLVAREASAGSFTMSILNIEQVRGSAQDDLIRTGPANETVTGGLGADTFEMRQGTDVIEDLGRGGVDILKVDSTATVTATVVEDWTASIATRNDGVATVVSLGSAIDLSAVNTGLGWSLINNGSATRLLGSALDDTLRGGTGDDTLTGNGGQDTFLVTAGTDSVTDLGQGVDILRVSSGATARATVVAPWVASADSRNDGSALIVTTRHTVDLSAIQAGGGWTVSNVGAGGRFVGSALNDTMTGGTGDDTLVGWDGDDVLNGGDGVDLLDYEQATGAVFVDLAAGLASGAAGNDQLSGFEHVLGSLYDDTLAGGAGDDSLTGGAGNDLFRITAGTDRVTDLGVDQDILRVLSDATLLADAVNDWIASGASSNSGTAIIRTPGRLIDLSAITTGTGWQILNTGARTTLIGSALNDQISGGTDDDTLVGSRGDDTLDGGAGVDLADYSAAQGAVVADLDAGTVVGGTGVGSGTDTLIRIERIRGSGFDDTLTGGSRSETLIGGEGADRFNITAGSGTATVSDLGEGADVLTVVAGGTVDAYLVQAWTASAASTNSGVARLHSPGLTVNLSAITTGAGWQIFNTGPAAALIGSALGDTLTSGVGNDTLTGGPGGDRFVVSGGTDTLTDLSAGDSIQVDLGGRASGLLTGAWTASSASRNDGWASLETPGLPVDLSAITAGASGWIVESTGGDTPIYGSALNDTLKGGAGADTIRGGLGNDSLVGGAGSDTVDYGVSPGAVMVNLTTGRASGAEGEDTLVGFERIVGSDYSDTLTGGSGSDTLVGGLGDDHFFITSGTDTVSDFAKQSDSVEISANATAELIAVGSWIASAASANSGRANLSTAGFAMDLRQITGGTAGWRITNTGSATTLIGSTLADSLIGGSGADILRGFSGDDVLTGRGAGDTFVIDLGTDSITDLGDGLDVVQVAAGASLAATLAGAWTASAASFNQGVARLGTPGHAVNLTSVASGVGWQVTNTGTAAALTGSSALSPDSLIGGSGDDTLKGGIGNDQLTGGGGADTFDIDSGSDTVTDLGVGADTLIVRASQAVTGQVTADWVATSDSRNDGTANLVTQGASINLGAIATGLSGWRLSNSGTAASLRGSQLTDTLVGGTGQDTLRGDLGDDQLTGGLEADTFLVDAGTDQIIDLGVGQDVLVVSTGATVMATLAGAWTATADSRNEGTAILTTPGATLNLAAVVDGGGWRLVNSGQGASVTGSANNDTLIGGAGDDTLAGGHGDDEIQGGTGTDLADYQLASSPVVVDLEGGPMGNGIATEALGTDTLISIEWVRGSAFDDTLTGSSGNDSFTGGLGADTFNINAGVDAVTDLGRGADVVQVLAGATVNATLGDHWTASSVSYSAGTANLFANGWVADLTAITTGLGWSMLNTGAATRLYGTAMPDTIQGGSQADTIRGGAGDDSLTGGGGADLFDIDLGTDRIVDLGVGADVVQVAAGATVNATVSVSASWSATSESSNLGTALISTPGRTVSLANITTGGGWVITNTGAATALTGSGLDDTLTGAAGNDTLTGSAGADHFYILQGTDTLTDLGVGVDVVEVAAGASLVGTVASPWVATVASLNDGTARLNTSGVSMDLSQISLGASGWTLTNSGSLGAAITGSALNDTITGGTGADTLAGSAGDDLLDGGAGVDTVDYSSASAAVNVDLVAGVATGGAGSDTLLRFERIVGSALGDTLRGSAGNDTLTGGTGADRFLIAEGADVLTDLGVGGDVVIVDAAASLEATVGAAWTATVDTVNQGTVRLTTNGLAVNLIAVVNGLGWSVENVGERASITGSALNDTLLGGAGDDTLFGSAGNDSITGGDGRDSLLGGQGDDVLVANGLDTVVGGTGQDLIRILDAELIDVRGSTAAVFLTDSEIDTIDLSLLSNGALTVVFTSDLNAQVRVDGTLRVQLNAVEAFIVPEAPTFFSGGGLGESVTGGSLDDSLQGGGGNDTLIGGQGRDQIMPGSGEDQVMLGEGNDVLVADSDWLNDVLADTIEGGLGFDSLRLVGTAQALDLTDTTRFAGSRIEGFERIDLGLLDEARLLTVDPAAIVALTGRPASSSALVIDGDAADRIASSASIGAVAARGTVVAVDVNGNGTVTDFEDELGAVGPTGQIAYDFGAGAGFQTYTVYADSSYGLLLVDSDIDRTGLLFS